MIRKNVVANVVGQGWRALVGVLFVPVYVKYLGIEAYGLVGVFAILQAWLGLFDAGTRPMLGREMARFGAGARDRQSIRDLLRTVEIVSAAIALAVASGVWSASEWLASEWLRPDELPLPVVAEAFAIMGLVISLRFMESLYVSALIGLQRQVLENIVGSSLATLRAVGAIVVLAGVSPTIQAFFLWQAVVSLLAVGLCAVLVHRILPAPERPARFSTDALRGTWQFAGGMFAITLLALLLTQVDKILLARLLPLETFSYYAFAGVVSGVLYTLCSPITTAFYPRFTELWVSGDHPGLAVSYHLAAQLITVFVGTVAVVLVAFANQLLLIWTGDPLLSERVAPLLRVLVVGTLLHSLMWVPYHLQLASGWTSLSVKVNLVAVVVLIPTIVWAVPAYGAIGAAWVAVGLNTAYMIFTIYFMHRRLLPTDKWCWYGQDVFGPLLVEVVILAVCAALLPADATPFLVLSLVTAGAGCSIAGAALAAPAVRAHLLRYRPRSAQ